VRNSRNEEGRVVVEAAGDTHRAALAEVADLGEVRIDSHRAGGPGDVSAWHQGCVRTGMLQLTG
jgi:hypothetical protein